MTQNKHVVSMLVRNHFGVLNRISGLITRRGYNIDSLTVAITEDANFSRMTIVLSCDEMALSQIIKQLRKQEEVVDIARMTAAGSVMREHVLVKIACAPERRAEAVTLTSIFRVGVVDVSRDAMIIELTGESEKIDAFIEVVRPFGIQQVVRSGVTGLPRGNHERED